MNWILVLAVIIAVAVIALAKFKKDEMGSVDYPKKSEVEFTDYPYQKAGVLFTPAERSFLGVLNQAVEERGIVLGKVRVADVMIPKKKKGLSPSERQRAFNKISAKHFDFLLCNNNDLSVICAVELNDSSHQSRNRQKRDKFLKGACGAAGIPLIQITVKSSYVIDEVKHLLAPHIGEKRMAAHAPQTEPEEALSNEKICPKCSSPMVKRIAKKGSNAGSEFWGCTAFPKCRYVEAINADNYLTTGAILNRPPRIRT
ncbi:MAG: DUF2726 domain-containing protein [Deltaproteobacteria bacterium]|nr:DUF2726 domain-containing protein [Deltaproteobacteria bacterium]